MRKYPSAIAVPAAFVLGILLTLGVSPASALTPADIPAPVTLMAGTTPFVSTDPATGTSLVVARQSGTIVGQLFDANFVALDVAFTISESGSAIETPSAEWNPEDKQWLVVWHDDAWPSKVNGRILALNGTFVTSQLLIANQDLNGNIFYDSELVFASYAKDQDGYLVAFKTSIRNIDSASCQAAMVSWIGADGTVPTTSATPVSSDDPAVSCNQIDNGADLVYSTVNSEWIVAWYDSASQQTMIRRVRTGASPTVIGTATAVGTNTSGGSAAVAYDPSRNRVLVGWHTSGTGGNDAVGAFVSAADVVTPTTIASGSSEFDWRRPRLVYVPATGSFFAALHSDSEPAVYMVQIDAATGVAQAPLLLEGASTVRPSISTDGRCLWIVWQSGSNVRGTTTCTIAAHVPTGPQLAATGQDPTSLVGAGLIASLLGGIGVAMRRRHTVNSRYASSESK
ncbi:MAG: hypothetical protein ABIW32_02310 [Terrimesophilobacter sp.]